MFPFSVKDLGLRTAPSDVIPQPYPHPKPYLRTETDTAPEELSAFSVFLEHRKLNGVHQLSILILADLIYLSR